MTTPTEPQSAKFKKFMAHPLKEKAIAYLNLIVTAANLDLNDLGVAWGITLCADTKSVLRVNVSNRYLADVIFSKTQPEGLALLCVIGEPQILGPMSMRIHSGFKNIKDSTILTCELGQDSNRLLSEYEVQRALTAHANTLVRNLPNSNWHNPLSASLINQGNDNLMTNFATESPSESEKAYSKLTKHIAEILFILFIDETLDQKEEDLLAKDFDNIAKDLCASMTLKIIDSTESDLTVSIELVSPISEPLDAITAEESVSLEEIAEVRIEEHIAMMLFAFFADPDESEEENNALVDDVNEITQILWESMNIVVKKIEDKEKYIASVKLTNPIKFLESIVEES